MRVLHISNYYLPNKGGIEDVCFNIVENIDAEHKVLCFNHTKKTLKDFYKGIEIIRVGFLFKIASQALSVRYYFIMKKILIDYSPDIIHFHAPNPLVGLYLLLNISSKCKLIVHWHSDIVAQKILYKFIRPIESNLIKRANKVIATSPLYVEGSIILSMIKEKITIIPNVITDTKLIRNQSDTHAIEEIKQKYGHKMVFFMGRHVEYKGLEYLIKAEKFITNDCSIIIAGSGPLTKSLKTKTYSQRIHFIGKINDNELRFFLHASSIFAFPSITKNEAFGVALAEAMYCGLPAVTFNITGSGVNWVNIHEKTGLEVENSNIKAYAKAIDLLLDDEEKRKSLGFNAKKRIEQKFTIKAVMPLVQKLYDEIVPE